MFHYSKEDRAYLAEINGVELICETPGKEREEQAEVLAARYESCLLGLARFMLDELDGLYGPLTVREFIARLGRPQINLDESVIRFLEHDFDDHILEVPFEGELEEFLVLTMDG